MHITTILPSFILIPRPAMMNKTKLARTPKLNNVLLLNLFIKYIDIKQPIRPKKPINVATSAGGINNFLPLVCSIYVNNVTANIFSILAAVV